MLDATVEKLDVPVLSSFKRPIGELLMEQESIHHHDLEFALEHQRHSRNGELLGQILIRMGAVSAEDLDSALATQIAQSIL